MPGDDPFLEKLAADPTDDTTRLVYADWLEEQGDPVSAVMAEFLRLTVQLTGRPDEEEKARRQRLQQLAADLDTDWLGVVSKLAVENCAARREESGRVRFDFLCERRWEDMRPTDDQAVRFCEGCRQSVHYCDTITEARRHAWKGHCIALDLGVIRRTDDLEQRLMLRGRASVETLRREEARMRPDPVSLRRARRKGKKKRQAEEA